MMMIKQTLDKDDCIDLLTVLRILNQIDQEQAWAICYELAKLMARLKQLNEDCILIENLAQIHLHKDGYVHEKTCYSRRRSLHRIRRKPSPATKPTAAPTTTALEPVSTIKAPGAGAPPTPPITPDSFIGELEEEDEDEDEHEKGEEERREEIGADGEFGLAERRRASSELELVSSLGIALFWALDYGIADDQERKLSLAMEYLICQTQNIAESCDLNLQAIIEICIKRLKPASLKTTTATTTTAQTAAGPAPCSASKANLATTTTTTASKQQADLYYRSILKSLIEDTIELSIFLEKICTASMVLRDISSSIGHHHSDCLADNHHLPLAQSHRLGLEPQSFFNLRDDDLDQLGEPLASLRALRINEWARLWMQVIRELRQKGRTFNNNRANSNSQSAVLPVS